MLNKILTKLQQKYSSSSLFQKGGFLAPADEQDGRRGGDFEDAARRGKDRGNSRIRTGTVPADGGDDLLDE